MSMQVLANNAMATIYNDHVDSANIDPVVVTTFRMACAVPPLLCALLFRDFAAIVGYGGESQHMYCSHSSTVHAYASIKHIPVLVDSLETGRYCSTEQTKKQTNMHVVVIVVSHIQCIGYQPEKSTLHSGQSRSWSAEQGKENKREVWQRPPPPPFTLFVRIK